RGGVGLRHRPPHRRPAAPGDRRQWPRRGAGAEGYTPGVGGGGCGTHTGPGGETGTGMSGRARSGAGAGGGGGEQRRRGERGGGGQVKVTSLRGLAELVDEGTKGLLVPPDDKLALARAARILLEDEPRRRRMGEAARQRARTRFPLSETVRALQEVYRGG